jgi:hypothetical protein
MVGMELCSAMHLDYTPGLSSLDRKTSSTIEIGNPEMI